MCNRIISGLLGLAAFAAVFAMQPQQAHAAGNLKFCSRWYYQYSDQGLGEDKLLHYSGSSYGRITAAYSWAVIERNGVTVWSGYTDANGCTGTIAGTAGSYKHWRTTALGRSGSYIWIQPTDSSGWKWFSQTVNLSSDVQNNATWTYTPNFGYGEPVSSVASAMTEVIKRTDLGLKSNTYHLYADQNCPGQGFAGCYTYSAVYLGTDNVGAKEAFNKTVVAHEMGHYVQDQMFGYISNNYNDDAPTNLPLCRCDHVTTANALHCLQSREDISTSQVEGWAQFFAMDLYNNNNETDAILAYYKEFLFFSVMSPPVALNLGNPVRWMEQLCDSSGDGTELDWSTFYWELNNEGSYKYSYANLETVYENVCGGTCSGDHISWYDLNTAANNVYGSTSAKAARLRTTAAAHGVDK